MADLDDFQQSVVDAHNKLRSERGLPNLAWAEDISTSASNWAQNISEKGYLQNSDNQVLGENILMTTEDVNGDEVVSRWLQEEKLFDYDNMRWQRGTSRFTQMIWRSSTEIGVAKVPLRNKKGFVIVANYRPRGNGNRPGEYQKNIPSKNNNE
ncbi:Golgi-associated plant pathogenesis-related protein 1-like [Lytechinus variegatus]|uniref:Golgi-associated plant pathogenesis-related protein 1-like n=1 Tax=Lytechinus variegatus TaxID=7654 RepID=UPI001BB1982D|nr:Golgi-associated plant pathogenesis-related protein 1-like [Lytechinus variegatus]